MIQTIRFTKDEMRAIDGYLKRNPAFDSLSNLGRVATMEFIRTRTTLPLIPTRTEGGRSGGGARPSFLWDYDLTEEQVQEILRRAPFDQRKWLIARILERLSPPEVLRYLSLEEIRRALPQLRMDPRVQRHWQEAVELWTEAPQKS